MKFWLAVLAFVLIAVVLGAGILLMMHGKPLFLVVATLAYLLAFAKVGCLTH